jgi:hypothetical protein
LGRPAGTGHLPDGFGVTDSDDGRSLM